MHIVVIKKRIGVAILILEKTGFKIKKDKEHYALIMLSRARRYNCKHLCS